MPTYRDTLLVFHRSNYGWTANVWSREFPGGRQRRAKVATYRLEGLPENATPQELLRALLEVLRFPPTYTT